MRALLALALVALLAAPTLAWHGTPWLSGCYPGPFGRCGAYNREVARFCWIPGSSGYPDATHRDALGIGPPDDPVAYLREGLAYRETNDVPGLQTAASFRCGIWVYYAEELSWLGPYIVVPYRGDARLV